MHEANNKLANRGAHIGTLDGQFQELQSTIGECDVMLDFSGDQLHDLQLGLDDAQAQLHQHDHALHAPPDEMQVEGEEEP